MFAFRAWGPADHIGDAPAIAEAFTRGFSADWAKDSACPNLTFEIIDLRLREFSAETVAGLIEKLAKLLLADAGLLRNFSANSRLLFVGGVRTLATREAESDAMRAIKQDAEFYIRALQNYDVAHYAGIGAEDIGSEPVSLAIRSALIGMSRHYRDPARCPPNIRLTDRLTQIGADIEELTRSARKLPEFRYLGSPDTPQFDGNRIDYLGLLREIGLIYQFGKGERPEPYSATAQLAALEAQNLLTFNVRIEHSSYRLFVGMLSRMGDWARAFHASAVAEGIDREKLDDERLAIGDGVAQHSFKLARYDLLRDFGRVLGQGTLQRFRELGTTRPILLIDDEFYEILTKPRDERDKPEALTEDHLIGRLAIALASVGRAPGTLHVVPSAYIDAHLGLMQADGPSRLIAGPGRIEACGLDRQPVALSARLDDYVAILIDPESRRDACGPVRVQRLGAFLEQQLAGGKRADGSHLMIPPVLAFSRKESSGYVQQCLNMGASAFIAKTRPFHLLFGLSRALRDERRRRRGDGEASQFRILKTLKPHAAAKLLRGSGPSYVYGGMTFASGKHIVDPREARWIQSLPKSDLHYHFGTAIDFDIVNLLAMNTAGHFLSGAPDPTGDDSGDSGASPLLRRLAETLALTARLERLFVPLADKAAFSRMELLAAAASATADRPGKPLDNRPFGLGDAIVQHLVDSNDRCDDAHATALLVAMMASRPAFGLGKKADAFFGTLIGIADADVPPAPANFTSEAALALEMRRAQEHFNRVACRWNGSCTREDFEALARAEPGAFWTALRAVIETRVTAANSRLHACLARAMEDAERDDAAWQRALGWLKRHNPLLHAAQTDEPDTRLKANLDLSDYAAVPNVASGRGLQLYLRGADLLGSSHLQYPENLWLAALAITLDNATQNVIYSEVRCETTGYTRAGMGAHDATEMLRHGFNLASLYAAGHNRPLVRTNILLAAKRHKREGEARAVVQLLEAYLERRAAVADAARSRRFYVERFGETMPRWWRPCDVVGFDLSGDESRDEPWLKTVIVPLAARSSPVTIHAGEAANAESIWRAVYELNALRIGHGLRLNEDTALLGYCVREGICMELCPNSNRYTNQIDPHPRRDGETDPPIGPLRYEYPLLDYLSQGMEVSLGTDNRYLHREGLRTLTSEYLTAAELVGGLTRWEILQMVKAGFKNAFLDKAEVRAMIEAVEVEIYRIVATDFA